MVKFAYHVSDVGWNRVSKKSSSEGSETNRNHIFDRISKYFSEEEDISIADTNEKTGTCQSLRQSHCFKELWQTFYQRRFIDFNANNVVGEGGR